MNTQHSIDLEAMRNVDIRNVDSSALADIRDINIDPSLPINIKSADYLRQSKGNAYCFVCDGVIVKLVHSKTTTTMNDCLENFFQIL